MDEKILLHKISGAMFRRNISNIHSHRDMYKDINYRDISKTDIDNLLESKKVFEWILEHPEYNYTQFSDYDYPNDILYNYFKIYYEYIIYTLDRYFKEDYIIKYSDFIDE